MFEPKDFVFYGAEGVCQIDDIVTSPFTDMDTVDKYFVLHSMHNKKTGTMFIPVSKADSLMRKLMSKAEIGKLMREIKTLPLINADNLKRLKERYSEAMRSGRPDEWVRVIKTVYERTLNGRENGRKVSDAERSFSDSAKLFLYKEMSMVLGIPEESVENYINNQIGESAV